MNYRSAVSVIALMLVCGSTGCMQKNVTSEAVSGTYQHDYADGRIEVWLIHADYTFEQRFYASAGSLAIEKPFTAYNGTWSFKQNGAHSVLSFEASYSLQDYGTGQPLQAPEMVTGVTAGWRDKPTGSYLDFFADDGYVAYKKGDHQ
jgi:hypothetical protein